MLSDNEGRSNYQLPFPIIIPVLDRVRVAIIHQHEIPDAILQHIWAVLIKTDPISKSGIFGPKNVTF